MTSRSSWNPAILDLGVIAYAGVPVHLNGGVVGRCAPSTTGRGSGVVYPSPRSLHTPSRARPNSTATWGRCGRPEARTPTDGPAAAAAGDISSTARSGYPRVPTAERADRAAHTLRRLQRRHGMPARQSKGWS